MRETPFACHSLICNINSLRIRSTPVARFSLNTISRTDSWQPVVQGSEFRKREHRRLIEWFASKDIEKIEDAEFRRAIRPIKALQQEKEAQKQLSLLVLPLPRLARTQQHP
jgi:hypothetical protein